MNDPDYPSRRRRGAQKRQPPDRMFTNLPRPREDFEVQRGAPAMIRAKAHEPEISGSGKTSRPRSELEDFFESIEPGRNRGGWFLGLLASAWFFWRREREIRRSIAALSEMDDRTLRDIGIEHRAQIPTIVRNGR